MTLYPVWKHWVLQRLGCEDHVPDLRGRGIFEDRDGEEPEGEQATEVEEDSGGETPNPGFFFVGVGLASNHCGVLLRVHSVRLLYKTATKQA